MIPYTPRELMVIAEPEYAFSLAEMKKAARELGFGDDWKAAMESVKNTYVEPGRQPDLIRDLARQRSEEHTSELQSHSDLVCRLLLEKKKRQRGRHNDDGDQGPPPPGTHR